jgi:hypothetical protein
MKYHDTMCLKDPFIVSSTSKQLMSFSEDDYLQKCVQFRKNGFAHCLQKCIQFRKNYLQKCKFVYADLRKITIFRNVSNLGKIIIFRNVFNVGKIIYLQKCICIFVCGLCTLLYLTARDLLNKRKSTCQHF